MSSKARKLALIAIALGGLVVWLAWRSMSPPSSRDATTTLRVGAPDPGELIPASERASDLVEPREVAAMDRRPRDDSQPDSIESPSVSSRVPATAPSATKVVVRGRVVDLDDKPQRARVIVHCDYGKLGARMEDLETKVDGTFEFELEVASRCVVIARPREWDDALIESLPLAVDPGTEEVTVRLRRAQVIFGTVVDATNGEPRGAAIEVRGERGSGWGSAKLGRLQAFVRSSGIYAVSARSREGGWAIESNIVVPEGGNAGPIRIELRKAAHIRIVYKTSDTTLHCVVTADSYPLGEMDFSPQRGYELDVPPRAITVVLNDVRDTWKQTRLVTPSPGEKLDVEFN